MGNYTIFGRFENPRRGWQARNLTTNVPKILDLKSSSEQIFSKNCRCVPLKFSEPSFQTCSKTTTQLKRTTKCVRNIVFRFVYRSVEHAVVEVSFRFSKLADNIYLDFKKIQFFQTFVSIVNSQIANVRTGLIQNMHL